MLSQLIQELIIIVIHMLSLLIQELMYMLHQHIIALTLKVVVLQLLEEELY